MLSTCWKIVYRYDLCRWIINKFLNVRKCLGNRSWKIKEVPKSVADWARGRIEPLQGRNWRGDRTGQDSGSPQRIKPLPKNYFPLPFQSFPQNICLNFRFGSQLLRANILERRPESISPLSPNPTGIPQDKGRGRGVSGAKNSFFDSK